jgi:hypothetical protein
MRLDKIILDRMSLHKMNSTKCLKLNDSRHDAFRQNDSRQYEVRQNDQRQDTLTCHIFKLIIKL